MKLKQLNDPFQNKEHTSINYEIRCLKNKLQAMKKEEELYQKERSKLRSYYQKLAVATGIDVENWRGSVEFRTYMNTKAVKKHMLLSELCEQLQNQIDQLKARKKILQ
jgi:hypothetical protein